MAKEYFSKDAEPQFRATRYPRFSGVWCYRSSSLASSGPHAGALDVAEYSGLVCAISDIVDVKPEKVLAFLQDAGHGAPEALADAAGVMAAIEHFGGTVPLAGQAGFSGAVGANDLIALQKHLSGGMPAVVYVRDFYGSDAVVAAVGHDDERGEVLLFDPNGPEHDGWYVWDWVARRVRAFVLAVAPEDDHYAPRYIFKQIYGIDIAGHEQRWPDIDLEVLKRINPGCIGWIHLGGTPISYPVVKDRLSSRYYQTHNFSGEPSIHGAVSMSFANGGSFDAPNLVFSAHRMRDYSMFKMLTYYDRPTFADEHPFIDLLLGTHAYRAYVFAAYHFLKGEGAEAFRVDFDDDADFERWISERIELRMHPIAVPDRIEQVATFRTCYGLENDETFAVHAALEQVEQLE